jgi:hypothetical protein
MRPLEPFDAPSRLKSGRPFFEGRAACGGAYPAAFAVGWSGPMSVILAIPVLVTLGAIGTCVGCLWTALKEDAPVR